MKDNKAADHKLNKKAFYPPAILTVIVLLIGVLIPEQFGNAMSLTLHWITRNLGWAYSLAAFGFVVAALFVCFSKYGNIRLGGKDAKPEMGFFKWFCIVMTSGMATGIVYYSVGEPLSFFENPPVFSGAAGGSVEAAEQTLRYVFLHWTLHPYSMYVVVAVACAFMYWNCKQPFSVSSGLYPLLGDRASGSVRHWINALCILALVAGVGTTMGLVVDQLTVGLNYVFDTSLNPNVVGLATVLIFSVVSIVASSTGLHKGIAVISSANIYMFLILMVFALAFGGTRFIMANTVTSIGKYLSFFIEESLYLEPGYDSGWVSSWSTYYWAWWLVYAPLVGLFQIKMAKGRTIRQFVIVNLIAPSLFLIAWFGIFGSSVIHMGLTGNTIVSDAAAMFGNSVALFAYLKQLPLAPLLIAIGFLAVLASTVTLTEAECMTVADICIEHKEEEAQADKNSPVWLKAFWALAMCLLGFVLYYSGGLSAIQTSSIVVALPIMILLVFITISMLKGLVHYKEYDKTLGEGEDYEGM